MDPQSVTFIPQSDVWLTDAMRTFQQTQQDHGERLGRLERRHDSDAKVRSVWGANSPFPTGLSGTPTHGPHPSSQVDFSTFDDDEPAANMVRSLHLDTDDEPRRLNAASRANSVRFDESAKQSQWGHGQRSSVDLFSKGSTGLAGLGGHPMVERSTSHKSDGRQSSAGQSASGRANSLGLESSQLLVQASTDLAGFSPGLNVLGSVPSIIRCWLSQNFKHEALLYAAVCSGSYKSLIEMRLLEHLGLAADVRQDVSGNNKIRLTMYMPEAISHPSSSRPNSPAPALPSVTVEFLVVDRSKDQPSSKAIQIFIGSDTLRQYHGDVLFSTNSLAMYDDDRNRLTVPLVRPENDETFKTLFASGMPVVSTRQSFNSAPGSSVASHDSLKSLTNGFDAIRRPRAATPSTTTDKSVEADRSRSLKEESKSPEAPESVTEQAKDSPPSNHDRKPSLDRIRTVLTTKETSDDTAANSATSRTAASPAIWSNWRRDGTSGPTASDWAAASRASSGTYQRPGREPGIKVLKPSTGRSSTLKTSGSASQSPSTPQSRFFDEGRRRVAPSEDSSLSRSASGEGAKGQKDSGVASAASSTKSRNANPIGSASAFGWLGQK